MPAASPSTPRQPLKILFIHGYTQSGPLFYAKTRALVKHLQKHFPYHEISTSYPTAPIQLDPHDIPGYSHEQLSSTGSTSAPAEGESENGDSEKKKKDRENDAYGWWRRYESVDPPLYTGLEDGLARIACTLRDEGPFDGVIGFSQGAAMAAMVASLLEPGRRDAFSFFAESSAVDGSGGGSDADNGNFGLAGVGGKDHRGIPFPACFEELSHPPMKFALCYSGFRAPGARYRGFYEKPAIQSPVLHVLGSLDAVVEHSRSRALIDACEGDPEKDGCVVWHPGSHFLPSQRPYLDAAAKFIKEGIENKMANDSQEKEEDARDMDLPF